MVVAQRSRVHPCGPRGMRHAPPHRAYLHRRHARTRRAPRIVRSRSVEWVDEINRPPPASGTEARSSHPATASWASPGYPLAAASEPGSPAVRTHSPRLDMLSRAVRRFPRCRRRSARRPIPVFNGPVDRIKRAKERPCSNSHSQNKALYAHGECENPPGNAAVRMQQSGGSRYGNIHVGP